MEIYNFTKGMCYDEFIAKNLKDLYEYHETKVLLRGRQKIGSLMEYLHYTYEHIVYLYG